ncbi:MAG: hypothetical protein AB7F78_09745 [Hyphomicrobiaceae bacterium]
MRDETRRRLDRALLMAKLKWAAVGLAGVAVVAGIAFFQSLDASVKTTHALGGTVTYVGPPLGKYGAAVTQTCLQVDVSLDDKRVAHLLSPRGGAPTLGDHVMVAEQVHGSGRRTFAWK